MPALIYLPTAGETVLDGEIIEWYKNEGDKVEKGETVCEATTSKIVLEVTSPQSGILYKKFAKVGDRVPMGYVVAVIELEGEILSPLDLEKISDRFIADEPKDIQVVEEPSPDSLVSETPVKIKSSPIARKMAAERGIDLKEITGTGPEGRITKKDVLDFVGSARSTSASKEAWIAAKVIKLSDVRKIIAERLRESIGTKPHINFQTEVCMDELLKAKAELTEIYGHNLSVNTLITYVVIKVLDEYPYLNAHLKGDEIILHDNKNIGIAVGRNEKGLIVPVIKNANKMNLRQIEQEAKRLVALAREDKLQAEDITGGSFTISNLGLTGIKNFNAIINPPEVGILAVSATIKQPFVKGNSIEVASVMNINLAVDHSVIDGMMASQFVMRVKELLESPYSFLANP
jgi:pyruvate dehydrogenase E2 component (dihydrolipoamide acetyltransferase)